MIERPLVQNVLDCNCSSGYDLKVTKIYAAVVVWVYDFSLYWLKPITGLIGHKPYVLASLPCPVIGSGSHMPIQCVIGTGMAEDHQSWSGEGGKYWLFWYFLQLKYST